MSGTPSPDEMITQWQQLTKEGMDAWLTMLTRAPQPDISQYWMPFFSQSMTPLAQLLSQGASKDLLQLWKQFLDQGIDAWTRVLEQAMTSEGFVAAFGKSMDQYLGMLSPAQKEMKKASEAYLIALGLPSRAQIAEMASQISWVESRIEELEEKIEQVLAGLSALQEKRERKGSGSGKAR
jgi:outer membrane murein-binding lipoprotein Lpp